MRKIFCKLMMLLIAGAVSAATVKSYDEYGLPEFLFGGTTHFGQHKGWPALTLEAINEMGANSIRDDCAWQQVENRKGEYVLPPTTQEYVKDATKRGIYPLWICAYGNRFYDNYAYPVSPEASEGYIRYCESLVRQTGGDVRLFQIWNEWEGGTGMGKSGAKREDYVTLLKKVYPRLKAINPNAVVVANPIYWDNFINEIYLKLGMIDYCDVLSVHTYYFAPTFGGSQDWPSEGWYRRMIELNQLIRNYNAGKDKPLYVTEMGFPNGSMGGATYYQTAEYLTQILLLAKTLPNVKGFWWYDIQDDSMNGEDRESNFGLLRPDLTPKPAYSALQSIAPILRDGKFMGFINAGADHTVRILKFKLAAEDVMVMWTPDATQQYQAVFQNNGNLEKISVQLAGGLPTMRSWGYYNWPTDTPWQVNQQATLRPDQLSFSFGQLPLIIRGDLNQVVLASIQGRPAAAQSMAKYRGSLVDQLSMKLTNASFEESSRSLTGWQHGFAPGNVDIETSGAINGKQFARVKVAAPGVKDYTCLEQRVNLASAQSNLKPGEYLVVKISGMLRLKNIKGRGITFSLPWFDAGGARIGVLETDYRRNSTEWQRFSLESKIPPKAVSTGIAVIWAPGTTGTMDIDDVSCEVERWSSDK